MRTDLTKNQYSSLHAYIKRRLPKPASCKDCGKVTKMLDLANISNDYLKELTDWEYLCHKCHIKKDMRREITKNLKDHPKFRGTRKEFMTIIGIKSRSTFDRMLKEGKIQRIPALYIEVDEEFFKKLEKKRLEKKAREDYIKKHNITKATFYRRLKSGKIKKVKPAMYKEIKKK